MRVCFRDRVNRGLFQGQDRVNRVCFRDRVNRVCFRDRTG